MQDCSPCKIFRTAWAGDSLQHTAPYWHRYFGSISADSDTCSCRHHIVSVAPCNMLDSDACPSGAASSAARQQLQSLRHSDARPCGHDILRISPCNPPDSDTHPAVTAPTAAGRQLHLCGTRMHATAATTPSDSHLAICSTRAPAQRPSPLHPLDSTHAPAATTSPATGRQLHPLRHSGVHPCDHYILSFTTRNLPDSDACPSCQCVASSGPTA